jgi:riboflavin kinase/FMN adenylyltransferase
MKIIEGSSQITEKLQNPVVTIGNFDGVHVGHQALFARIIVRARAIDGIAVVYTFDPHPLKVLQPQRSFPLITTREEKQQAIERYGIDVLIREHFTEAFSQLSMEAFVGDILCGALQAKEVFIGPDYRFGKGRTGTTDLLKRLGERCGLTVSILSNIEVDGVEVRSTMIRNLILEGRVNETARFLGRPYTLKGTVVTGHAIGRTIGIPTANLNPEKELYPRSGIFAVRVLVDQRTAKGVLSIGSNPTFPGKGYSLEVHILDFEGELYGKQIELIFIQKLRDEKQFESPEKLVEQIRTDIKEARKTLEAMWDVR